MSSHSDSGIQRLLTRPWVYAALGRLLSRRRADWLVVDYLKPRAGCRILDLGCGPGTLADLLPATVHTYLGIDNNPNYIDAARKRHGARPGFSFLCADLREVMPPVSGTFDLVTAIGVLHHLDDTTAQRMFEIARRTLAPHGRFVTYDGVRLVPEHPIARWLLDQDRGKAIRTTAGYRLLAERSFDHVQHDVLRDTLRLPYSTVVMTMTQTSTGLRNQGHRTRASRTMATE